MIDATLGSVNLGSNILLRGLQADRIAVDVQRSGDGVAQILIADMEGGRVFELYGWYQFATLDAVLALQAGKNEVLLVHPKFSGNVIIIGGTALDDVVEYVDPEQTDWRVGSIYVMEA